MSSFPTLKFYDFWPTVSEIAFIVSDIVFWPSTILLISHGYNFLNCEMQTITVSTLGPTFVGTRQRDFMWTIWYSVQYKISGQHILTLSLDQLRSIWSIVKKIVVTSRPKNVIYFTLYKYIIYCIHPTYLYVHIASWEVHENLMSLLCW